MAPYLFRELMIIAIGVWLMAVLFLVYGFLLLKKQRKMFDFFYEKLQGHTLPVQEADKDITPASDDIQSISISKDEPIAKYKDMPMSESVDVSFVDKEE